MTKLTAKKRNKIGDGQFAFADQRKEPLENASHVRNAAGRFPSQTDGIAQAGGEDAVRAALDIHLPDGGPSGLHRHAALGHVAVRTDADIKSLSVRAGNQVLGPVVVDRTS